MSRKAVQTRVVADWLSFDRHQTGSTTPARSWPSTVEAQQTCQSARLLSIWALCLLTLICGCVRSNACLTAFDEMRWAFSKTYERTEKIKSLWASAVGGDGLELGPLPSLSAHLPYPLRPSQPRTRSNERYPTMPTTLQRMPSYNSDGQSPLSDDPDSEDPLGRPRDGRGGHSHTVYPTGLVGEGAHASASGYRNRGSLAQSLNVTLKLEDDSPEGGVWALPPSTSASTSVRGSSRSRGNSRGGSTSLGSSSGEMRAWREEAHLEVTLSNGHYHDATDEMDDGLGFALPANPSPFSAGEYGATRRPSGSFARATMYAAEPMSVGSSFEGYNAQSQHVFLDDPLYGDGYGRPQSGPDPFSYPTAPHTYPSYPTMSPPPPVQSQLPRMADPEQQQHQHQSPYAPQHQPYPSSTEGGPPLTPSEPPRHVHPYMYPDSGPAYHPPSSTVSHQQPVLPSIYRYQPEPTQTAAHTHPYDSFQAAPILPPIQQYPDQHYIDQHAPYPTYGAQQDINTLAPPQRMYDGEMAVEGHGQGGGGYFGNGQDQMHSSYDTGPGGQRGAGAMSHTFKEEGYTSDFPRHG